MRASATTCAPDEASATAAARPMPREAPVTSATRGDPSGCDALNRHSSRRLLGLHYGVTVAGAVKTTGQAASRKRRTSAERELQKWIFIRADYRLDTYGLAATEKKVRCGTRRSRWP